MNEFEQAKAKAEQTAHHVIEQMQESGTLSSLDHKFPYHCKNCEQDFEMSFDDIMHYTDLHVMPCGCTFEHLDFRRALQRIMDDKSN